MEWSDDRFDVGDFMGKWGFRGIYGGKLELVWRLSSVMFPGS